MRRHTPRKTSGFKLLYSPGDMALGARLASTRLRLVVTCVTLTAIFILYAIFTARTMRERSDEVVLNLLLISGSMLFILAGAYFQALLVGDLFFPGHWRERVILGRKPTPEASDDERVSISHFQDQVIPFYLVLVALCIGNYFLYEGVTGGFLSEYQRWGYQNTLMRSEDTGDRVRGIRNITSPLNVDAQEAPEVRSRLVELVSIPDGEVQPWALWAVGTLKLHEATSAVLEIIQDESASDELRARAAEAMGFLGNRQGALAMAERLISSMGRDELALGLLRGLGLARVPETASHIVQLLNIGPPTVRGHTFWALGRTRNRSVAQDLYDHAREGSPEERCWAAEALKFFAGDDDVVEAHALFASAPDVHCEPITWTLPYHWDEDSSFSMEIIIEESLAAKFLKVIVAAGGRSQRSFLADVVRDPQQPDEIRRLAHELVRRIDERR